MPNWPLVRLSAVLPFRYGRSLPERDRNQQGDVRVISSAGHTGWHSTAITSGPSVVIGRKGSIGTTYFHREPVYPIDTTFFVEGSDAIDIRFAFYLLQTLPLPHMNNDSAVPGLNRSQAEALEIHLPHIQEQRGIVATLGALDDKIESNRRAIELLENESRAYFSLLFSVEEVDSGIPLSDLVKVNPQRVLKQGTEGTYLGMSVLPENSAIIDEWETKASGSGQRFSNGDVLMARITPCLENGKTAVVDMLKPGETGWGSTEYVVLAPQGEISTPWIYCLVRTEEVRSFAIRSMNGTSGRQRFQASGFSNYRIEEPKQKALIKFNSIAMPSFSKMSQLRNENRTLRQLRDTLLPELLSGRIRVPEAREAVEAVV